jgi:hypothetical protein
VALSSLWSRVTGLITGGAVAGAAAASVAPVLEAVKQHANAQRAIRVLEPGTAARVHAQRLVTSIDPEDDAKRHGIGVARFNALVALESEAPGTAETLELWRRDKITIDQARKALHKAGLMEEYVEPVLELFNERLNPEVIATAVQRGILPNAGLLPVGPPTEHGRVPPMPMADLDTLAEGKSQGYDFERLAVLARIVGLPASPDLAARMVFRDIIERIDFDRAIAEGNTRNEWAPFLFEAFREIPTVNQFVEGRLRAWLDDAELLEGAARHGMSKADVELLLKVQGRPINFHQVFVGERRGGTFDGPTTGIDPAFLKSLQESNIRPEWYNLAWAQRYTYPSAFVLRALTTSGELTAAETERILLNIGWEPELAHKVPLRWAGGSSSSTWNDTRAELADEFEGGFISEAEYRAALEAHGLAGDALEHAVHLSAARRVKRYREKVIDAIAAAFVAFKIDVTTATGELAEVGVTGESATLLIDLWAKQRRDAVRLLTPAQLKKAYTKNMLNRADVLDELDDRGYSPRDAVILLDE